MDLRLAPTLVLLLGAVTAQTPTPAPAPAPLPAGQQDPDKPKASPAQEAEALTAERHRLELEIAYVRDRSKNARAILTDKLAHKQPSWKAIDAGVAVQPVAPAPMASQPRQARVANPDELTEHPNDTLLLVNGRAVPQRAFDELMEHLAKTPTAGDAAQRAQRVLLELIQLEGIAAQFQDNEAAERTGDLLGQLEAGKPIADLAKSVGTLPGASPEGKIELTRNSMYGLRFEHAAFATEPGKRARPFRNTNGLVIVQVDSVEKGETADKDKVVLHALQIPYTPDAQQLQKAQAAISMGQVDVVVRDQKTLEMLPEMFRRHQSLPAAPQPAAGRDMSAVTLALQQISDQLEALKGKDDAASKAQIDALQKRYDQLKQYLRAVEAGTVDQAKDDATTPPKPGETPVTPTSPAPAPQKPKAPDAPPKNG